MEDNILSIELMKNLKKEDFKLKQEDREIALVALDIDNTLTRLQPTLDKISFVFDKDSVPESDVKDFTLARAFDLTDEEESFFWKAYEYGLIVNSSFNKDAYDSIVFFCNEVYGVGNYLFVVITARSPLYEIETREWLKRHEIPLFEDTVIFTNGSSKLTLLEQNKFDLIVDDNPLLFDEIEHSKTIVKDSWICENLRTVAVSYQYNMHSIVDARISMKKN